MYFFLLFSNFLIIQCNAFQIQNLTGRPVKARRSDDSSDEYVYKDHDSSSETEKPSRNTKLDTDVVTDKYKQSRHRKSKTTTESIRTTKDMETLRDHVEDGKYKKPSSDVEFSLSVGPSESSGSKRENDNIGTWGNLYNLFRSIKFSLPTTATVRKPDYSIGPIINNHHADFLDWIKPVAGPGVRQRISEAQKPVFERMKTTSLKEDMRQPDGISLFDLLSGFFNKPKTSSLREDEDGYVLQIEGNINIGEEMINIIKQLIDSFQKPHPK